MQFVPSIIRSPLSVLNYFRLINDWKGKSETKFDLFTGSGMITSQWKKIMIMLLNQYFGFGMQFHNYQVNLQDVLMIISGQSIASNTTHTRVDFKRFIIIRRCR